MAAKLCSSHNDPKYVFPPNVQQVNFSEHHNCCEMTLCICWMWPICSSYIWKVWKSCMNISSCPVPVCSVCCSLAHSALLIQHYINWSDMHVLHGRKVFWVFAHFTHYSLLKWIKWHTFLWVNVKMFKHLVRIVENAENLLGLFSFLYLKSQLITRVSSSMTKYKAL